MAWRWPVGHTPIVHLQVTHCKRGHARRYDAILISNMKRALKTLLLWLLIVVLPSQGFAAAMLPSCCLMHHDSLAIAVIKNAQHHDCGVSQDHVGAIAYHLAPDSPGMADHWSGTPHKHQSSSCSACAACCVGATAPPSPVSLTAAYSSPESYVIFLAPWVAGFVPAGLKRPPRHIFA